MPQPHKTKILVTGVAGFLGSRFADYLLDRGDVTIVGVDDFSFGYPENVPDGVHLVSLSLGTPGVSGDVLNQIAAKYEGFDYVFHFAAHAAEGLSPFYRVGNYCNNLLATADVVNMCLRYRPKRLVLFSSMAAYGAGVPPFHEDDQCNPIDPYGVAKRAGELDVMIAGEQHGLDWCIIRPHSFYGPGQSLWQKYRNVLGLWMARLLSDQPLLIFGDGQQTRAFSYVDDSLEPMWQAAVAPEASKQVINLGGTEFMSIMDAAELLIEVAGGGSIQYAPPRHEVKHAYTTFEKSETLLGYRHLTGMREGLTQMWYWATDVWEAYPERREAMKIRVELPEMVYPQWREYVK